METEANIHPSTLEETPPAFLSNLYYFATSFIVENGWYLLGGGIILLYIWGKTSAIIYKWLDDRAERKFMAQLHKDPDLIRTRQEAQVVARQRMQMEYDAKAQLAEEKRKERERQRQELLLQKSSKLVRSGYRLSDDSSSNQTPQANQSKKDGWRPEYNPLSGGGSGGYRPSRRSCPGGGCGK